MQQEVVEGEASGFRDEDGANTVLRASNDEVIKDITKAAKDAGQVKNVKIEVNSSPKEKGQTVEEYTHQPNKKKNSVANPSSGSVLHGQDSGAITSAATL